MFITRYRDRTRMNHWAVALLFICAGLTGLALFHPSMYFFSVFFGGGYWTRVLHPFFGLMMVLGFVFLFFAVVRDNFWTRADTEWVKKAPKMVTTGDEHDMPPVHKYNAGQKGVFWVFAISLVLLLITGFMFWQPWFADFFPIPLRRVAMLVHAVAALALVLSVIVHVYAAIWVKGSFRAMTRGTVHEDWAKSHHPLWYKEVTQNTRDNATRTKR
ncbi:formate dehydrogenase subunit gamma [Massilia sp. CFBP9012]|uniref:formate dehydrogenase subunit gamma n=1 Tax=Massilia sp. CFBP9012 TaxID=3096531 RepID=UPI002A6AA1B6|nr:formate dehydrogenase subunit gamma [Massilia sp. CFBP9012]MDY0975655.1 formate dehydrogenase subunit gamma [Massilia sp. CFBP9012]